MLTSDFGLRTITKNAFARSGTKASGFRGTTLLGANRARSVRGHHLSVRVTGHEPGRVYWEIINSFRAAAPEGFSAGARRPASTLPDSLGPAGPAYSSPSSPLVGVWDYRDSSLALTFPCVNIVIKVMAFVGHFDHNKRERWLWIRPSAGTTRDSTPVRMKIRTQISQMLRNAD